MADSKIAFVCGTPLQIIGAMSIAVELKRNGALCDVFLRHDFADSHDAANGLREYGPFDNVYDVGYSSEGNWSIRGNENFHLEPPYAEVAAASLLDQAGGQTDGRGYDDVFCSYPYDTGLYLMAVNDGRSRLHRYDDGIGSYLGDAMNMHGFVDTWLFRPDMIDNTSDNETPVKRIPFDKAIVLMAESVFGGCDMSQYKGKRIVLLTQPVDTFEDRRAVDKKIRDALAPYAKSVIIRKHPRDDEPDDERFDYDTVGSPWELICTLGGVTDDSILIGACSTAQAMPHMIGDSHSHAIFTQEMYKDAMAASGAEHEYERGNEAVNVMSKLLGKYATRAADINGLIDDIEAIL